MKFQAATTCIPSSGEFKIQMDVSISLPSMGADASLALNDTGVDFSNDTQAMDF